MGSAYRTSSIIGICLDNLEFVINYHHLNLYVLENGYNSSLFSLIEFLDELKRKIDNYITYYNHNRYHWNLKKMPPV
ncbi:IS3 family transposase [Priestia megaterium]|uniref:IS3 family transposase n=1 Tax=Priestia megaterium TaxID=1404 RepID=UPI003F68884E